MNTTNEWEKELDDKFPYYPNEPIYAEENKQTRAKLKVLHLPTPTKERKGVSGEDKRIMC